MSRRTRIIDLLLGGVGASQLVGAAWLAPAGDQSVAFSDGRPLGGLCLLHNLFGVECPFCGMTRSFVALAHGHVENAFRFHPAGPLLFVTMVVLVLTIIGVTVRRSTPVVERKRFMFAFQTVLMTCLAIGVFNLVRS